jgi:hypothetical protein
MMNQYYEVVRDSWGYRLSRIPLGISAGFPEPERFSNDADLKTALVSLNHTPLQIESMMRTIDRLGGVKSVVQRGWVN